MHWYNEKKNNYIGVILSNSDTSTENEFVTRDDDRK